MGSAGKFARSTQYPDLPSTDTIPKVEAIRAPLISLEARRTALLPKSSPVAAASKGAVRNAVFHTWNTDHPTSAPNDAVFMGPRALRDLAKSDFMDRWRRIAGPWTWLCATRSWLQARRL